MARRRLPNEARRVASSNDLTALEPQLRRRNRRETKRRNDAGRHPVAATLRSPRTRVSSTLPLCGDSPEFLDLERLPDDRAADRGQRRERLVIGATGHERDALDERGVPR